MQSEDRPSGWCVRSVRQLVSSHYSGPSPTCEERQIQNAKEWGLLKTTAITWEHGWDWTKHKVPPQKCWGNKSIEVHEGDVLLTKAGPRHRVGVVAHVDATPPRIMASGKMIGMRPRPALVVPRILAGALGTSGPQKYLDHRTTGMAESQVNFSNASLLATEVMIPDLPEQQQIATILDTIDEAIRKTEQVIAKLQQMKQGLMHDLLTRGIDDNGELRDPERHPELFKETPIGIVPSGWSIDTLAGCSDQITDGDHHTPRRASSGVLLLSARNVLNGRIDLSDVDFVPEAEYLRMISRCHPEPGDVLISCSGTIGRVVEVPPGLRCALVRSAALVKQDRAKLQSRYLEWVLQSDAVQRQMRARQKQGAQPNLFQGEIAELTIPRPPTSEQRQIAAVLDAHLQRVRRESRGYAKLRLVKQGLMDDLLTGRVRVQVPEEVTA